MANVPDGSKLCRSRYSYSIHIYVGSTGETILKGSDNSVLKHFIKIDKPNEKLVTFPVFRIGVVMERDKHIVLVKNKKDIIVSLSMTVKDEQRTNKDAISTSGIIAEHVLFDHKFQALVESPEDTTTSSEENQGVANNPDSSVQYAASPDAVQQYKTVLLRLNCTIHRNRFKTAINFVSTKDGAGLESLPFDALCYGISQLVTESKSVILQKPDNNNPEMQIIVPPWNLREFCTFMQTVYGIYSTGLLIYQDLKYLYIIPKYSSKYAIPEGEYDTVHIYIIAAELASGANTIGYYKDNDGSRYVITTGGKDAFTPIDISEALKELQGNKFKVFDTEAGVESVTYDAESWGGTNPMPEYETGIEGSSKDASDKVRYFHNELSNPYLLDEHVLNLQFSQKMVSVVIRDADLSIFTFNRKYKLTILFDNTVDAEYGGDYRLLEATNSGSMNNNEPLSTITMLTLLRNPGL